MHKNKINSAVKVFYTIEELRWQLRWEILYFLTRNVKLNTPTGGWRKKVNHFVEGGDVGCREDKIKDLLRKMN